MLALRSHTIAARPAKAGATQHRAFRVADDDQVMCIRRDAKFRRDIDDAGRQNETSGLRNRNRERENERRHPGLF
jgi:hypothetical protein